MSIHYARAGHLGVTRKIDIIRNRRLPIPNYVKIVHKYIKHCVICQPMRASKLLLNAYESQLCTEPWYLVQIDHITKLPKTKRGSTAILFINDRHFDTLCDVLRSTLIG